MDSFNTSESDVYRRPILTYNESSGTERFRIEIISISLPLKKSEGAHYFFNGNVNVIMIIRNSTLSQLPVQVHLLN